MSLQNFGTNISFAQSFYYCYNFIFLKSQSALRVNFKPRLWSCGIIEQNRQPILPAEKI